MTCLVKKRVDADQLLDDGFIIFRQVITPDLLETLRVEFEILVERQKEIWARDRKPDDPPSGRWETNAQPRLSNFQNLIDEKTAGTVAFCLHENTMGVTRQLMRAPEAANTAMMMMCNPVRDRGPANWHRDIHPIDQAPLHGLQMDLLENAPAYLQWNIPLYDDDVLWVVPGSHRRPNTEQENRQLLEDRCVALPESMPVELKAGDGVEYTNTILHWGSNYSAKLRRTIHLGYRSFRGPIFPYVPRIVLANGFVRFLSDSDRTVFEQATSLYEQECDTITSLYHAIIRKDAGTFQDDLAKLHPAERGRIVCVVLLSKLAFKLRFGTHDKRKGSYLGDWSHDEVVAPRLSQDEIETLWQRFLTLDAKLKSDQEQFIPGFQSAPIEYFFEEMPADFDVDAFIASWR